jgi:DNA repair protein RecO (recombination protein O)
MHPPPPPPAVRLTTQEALILDVVNLHERDRIVTFLTRDSGRKKGVAQGSRTRHSRFAGQLQPLATVSITWLEKEGRELCRISAVELVRPVGKLQEDLEGILLTSYLADHVSEFAQEDEPGDALFRLLESTLTALLAGVDRDLAARYFEAWMLRLAGIFPAPRDCPICGRPFGGPQEHRGAVLPPQGDSLVCFDCGGQSGFVATGETLAFLRQIGRQALPAVRESPPPAAVLRQVEELAGRVRRAFLQRELRSYEVMKQTGASL